MPYPHVRQWSRLARTLGVLVLLAGIWVVPPTPPSAAADAIQPALQTYAAAHPDAAVNVIVQQQAGATQPQAAVAALGGTVTQDLSIIHAFAATLPARNVAALAATPGVRAVSLNAPVAHSDISTIFNAWANSPGRR